jgi:RHS repeat-associated protein
MTYDANGNLTNDGTNSYSWDARSHLVEISGRSGASFAYDPFGRRASKTINSTNTQFLHDDQNPVQELQGGTPSANLLTGLGIDEYFSRTDSSGSMSFLSDDLGSTMQLTDAYGNPSTNYTYDPFGSVSASGASSANQYQFTGRENDGTGLNYHRARYYSPAQRFASQDPMRIAGGINLYAYTSDEPVRSSDKLGLAAYICHRPIQGLPRELGPVYHQYICVVLDHATYCFGFSTYDTNPLDVLLDSPGSIEGDKPNSSCKQQSTLPCVDSCLLGVAEGSLPDYSLINFMDNMNCQDFDSSVVSQCLQKCSADSH